MKKKFTLVEVLLAMFIFVIAIGPVLGLLTATTDQHIESTKHRRTAVFASQIRAQLETYALESDFGSDVDDYRYPKSNGMATLPNTPGMYYAIVPRRITNNLVQFKLGVSYSKPEDYGKNASSGSDDITVNAGSQFLAYRWRRAKGIYIESGDGAIVSSGNVVVNSDGKTVVFKDVVSEETVSSGKGYPLDHIFSLYISK